MILRSKTRSKAPKEQNIGRKERLTSARGASGMVQQRDVVLKKISGSKFNGDITPLILLGQDQSSMFIKSYCPRRNEGYCHSFVLNLQIGDTYLRSNAL